MDRNSRIEQEGGIFASCEFEYLSDARFQKSPIREEISKLKIPESTLETATKVAKELDINKSIKIITRIPNDEERHFVIPSLGLGGRTNSSNEVVLYIDPQHPQIIESINKYRNPQIAHELVHIKRSQCGLKNETLLDKIINEGLATYYEEHWENLGKTPWGNNLTLQQEIDEWRMALPKLNALPTEDWFFARDKKHPLWTGYTLGKSIVKAFFEANPMYKMKDVAKMDSHLILEKANYNPHT